MASTVSGNSTSGGGSTIHGAGIFNSGTLTLVASVVSDNTSSDRDGDLGGGGG